MAHVWRMLWRVLHAAFGLATQESLLLRTCCFGQGTKDPSPKKFFRFSAPKTHVWSVRVRDLVVKNHTEKGPRIRKRSATRPRVVKCTRVAAVCPLSVPSSVRRRVALVPCYPSALIRRTLLRAVLTLYLSVRGVQPCTCVTSDSLAVGVDCVWFVR